MLEPQLVQDLLQLLVVKVGHPDGLGHHPYTSPGPGVGGMMRGNWLEKHTK